MKSPSFLSYLLKTVFVCCSNLPIISSCGTQVGNPTDNDGPTKNSTDNPKESPKPAADKADSNSIENPPTTTQGLPTLLFTSTGIYKFIVVTGQGTTCSAEITIDQDLIQKNVSISVSLL
jgi:hypothetical protein